VVGRTR